MTDNLRRSDAFARSELLTDVAYGVDIDLTAGDETFASRTVVTFACRTPGSDTFIDLDAATVDSATLNGHPLAAEAFDGQRLRLEGLEAANELVVQATCRYQNTGVGLHRFVDPVDDKVYLYTQFEAFEAHRVYACFDQPDLKAPFALEVDAPAGWVVVSNGAVTSRPEPGAAGRWSFAATPPVSTYITAIVAGPYESVHDRHGEIDLGIYCRASLLQYLDPDEIFEITKQGFDFFTREFAYRYAFAKYDQLFVPEFNAGAMENAACVTFAESFVFRSRVTEATRRRRAEVILHEMAHMWFGNLVTMRWWDDLWLNESFATYLAYRALVGGTRFTDAWADFAVDLKAWAYNQDQLPSTHPVVADMVDTDAVRNNFDGITYAKGASVLRQLAAWVGDESFVEGLRRYFPRHEFANAELRDFLAALEEASGRPLGPWAQQWLQTAGVGTLAPVTDVEEGRYSAVAVAQEAPDDHPVLRASRVGVGLYDLQREGLVVRRRVFADVDGAVTPVKDLVGEPVADLLLVNDDDLAYAKIRLDERSVATLGAHLGRLVDPLARSLCWGALWNMTRDGELAARRYVRLGADHAHGEADVGVLGILLTRMSVAIDSFGRPDNRSTIRRYLAERAEEATTAAEPGTDPQLVWARSFAAVAQSEEQIATVRGLLDGSVEIEGLAVDTDLRWHLLTCLAALGAADEAAIAAEADRDPTDQGLRRAATARAARPDADAKAEVWDAVVNGDSMPLAMRRALVSGFTQYGQETLLRPYAQRYVDQLPQMWNGRNAEESLLLTAGLYPNTIIEEATLQLADQAMALPGVPQPGKRLILEGRDSTRRALRAREADHD